MADRRLLLELLNQYNNFYLYEESVILESIGRLKANFPDAQFLYSMKCNPARRVLDTVFSQGFGTDAASLGEVIAAGEPGGEKFRRYRCCLERCRISPFSGRSPGA